MTDDPRRLRSLCLRTEDVVLLRLALGIALRIIGGLLVVLGVGNAMAWMGAALRGGVFSASLADLFFAFGRPATDVLAGVAVILLAGPLSRRLAPATTPAPACPACGYHVTSLADGRCPECGYAVSPLRDGPPTATERLARAHGWVAAGLRLLGLAVAAFGAGRFTLQGLSDMLLVVPTAGEQFRIDREMVWSVILIVLGLLAFGLADRLARTALLGLRQDPRPKDD
jgi:hypothetical protein